MLDLLQWGRFTSPYPLLAGPRSSRMCIYAARAARMHIMCSKHHCRGGVVFPLGCPFGPFWQLRGQGRADVTLRGLLALPLRCWAKCEPEALSGALLLTGTHGCDFGVHARMSLFGGLLALPLRCWAKCEPEALAGALLLTGTHGCHFGLLI